MTTGQWARFWTEFPQIATLESFDDTWKVVKREIVQITARNDDDLTVVRAFAPCPANDDANSQSQSSISFSADDQISLYIPKEIFDWIKKSLNDIYDNGTNNMRTELVSWLQVEVNPWQVLVWSAYYDFAGWTITLTNNATNYLEVDEDGNLVNNTSGRNDENTKLAIITTSSWSVTNIKDRRLWTIGWKIGGVNIHDLTEKENLDCNDEFILSDSEAIFQNKKIKAWNLLWIWNWVAVENISKWDFVFNEWIIDSSSNFVSIWFSNNVQKISIKRVWNWIEFDEIHFPVSKTWNPTILNVRIETDNWWNPSWTLIDENAYWTINWSDILTTPTTYTISLAGNITIEKWAICHIVFAIDIVDEANFFNIYWYWTTPHLLKIKQYNWIDWNDFVDYNPFFNILDMTQVATRQYWRSSRWFEFVTSWDYDYLFYPVDVQYNYVYLLRATKWATIDGYSESWWNWSIWTKSVWWTINEMWTRAIIVKERDYYEIRQRVLTTARDISNWTDSAINLRSIWFTAYNAYSCATFSKGWQHCYFGHYSSPRIYQLDFNTWFDISTYSVDNDKTVYFSNLSWAIKWITISPDWRWLYFGNWNYIHYAYLSTPFEITTAIYMWISWIWISYNNWMAFMPNWDLCWVTGISSSGLTLHQYSSSSLYGQNILANITATWLSDLETWKADKSFFQSYIPCASIWDYTPWQTVKYNISYNNNLENLSVWWKYYLWTNWQVETTPSDLEVWIAIEPTILKLKQTY